MINRRAVLPLLAATLGAPSALGCSLAAARGSISEQVLRARRSASAVVLARVVHARFENAPTFPFGESPLHLARLEVIEKWKGRHEAGSELQTIAPTRAGTCAAALMPGETYLLYLHGREPYDLSLVRRYARLDDASDDMEVLRSQFGKRP